MVFQSLSFLTFLAVTVIVCLAAGKKERRYGKLLLTGASMLFCLLGDHGVWALVIFLLGSAVSGFAIRAMSAAESARRRRRLLLLACCWHIGVLVLFKYTGFFTGGAVSIGWAPLGLSFFTFEQLWLLKEVYTGQYHWKQGDSLVLYALFFPCLTSGPILRPGDYFPQLEADGFLRPGWQDIAAGLYGICWGLVKKILLADPLGVIVGNGWGQAGALTASEAWLVILCYTLQLYLDFSGYCDMAAGAARLLGLRLPVNFDSPYRALSVGEFWKRWHMTLTAFLRECVYFPLGGSRRGPGRTYLHILLVFLISGFWHGAGWTFLVWGLLHGLAQILERIWGPRRERLPKALRWAMTFFFINIAWVFFRAPSLSAAGTVLRAALFGGVTRPGAWLLEGFFTTEQLALEIIAARVPFSLCWVILAVILVAAAVVSGSREHTIRRMDTFRPALWQGILLAVVTGWCVLSFTGITTFIYSNF